MNLDLTDWAKLIGLQVLDNARSANCKLTNMLVSDCTKPCTVCLITGVKALYDGGGVNEVAATQDTGQVWIQLGHRQFLGPTMHPDLHRHNGAYTKEKNQLVTRVNLTHRSRK